MTIRLAGFSDFSLVDGEGVNAVVWFQGCKHHCEGCHSKHTWDMDGGKLYTTQNIINKIKNTRKITTGVTLSGGDPLYQYKGAVKLAKSIKQKFKDIKIWLYTGFRFETIKDKFPKILDYVDVIVDGKYKKHLPSAKWRGSNNQRIFNLVAGSPLDLAGR